MPALGFIHIRSRQALRTAQRYPDTFPRLNRNAYVPLPANICYRCGIITTRTIVHVRGYVDVAYNKFKIQSKRGMNQLYNNWLWRENGKDENEEEDDLFDLFDLRYLFGEERVEEIEMECDWKYDMFAKNLVKWIDMIYDRN
ncbi:uncharacterized protein LOC118647376 [Monomorium pharaonis]|uniref:uncharacterized protein LOC118647376 n=1 Tax=Monomorium pharaonis TaxID=307658 RepID=UPI001747C781|nr:uncharacterized protein LOC118647376 [Monomorium pharaonis]